MIYAEEPLLSPEQAFLFQVESVDEHQVQLSWKIEKGYYLYQHQFSAHQAQQSLSLSLPKAQEIYDENFGHTTVYFDQVDFNLNVEPAKQYQITWQGCAENRICYPPQHIEFQTDLNGLVSTHLVSQKQKKLTDLANNVSLENQALEQTSIESAEKAQDQVWLNKLNQHSLATSLILFFGLGLLLAFTPCSLPMLPIITSLLIREHRGLKAWVIALTFVSSMALVYALLGLIASSAGLNFQRWLQQPFTLIVFSALFVIFALNLFGLFEFKLPQGWVNRLDRMQSMQRGGTLIGAAVMGTLSALLVGPCMTAPLAGALLFISQTQNQLQGAVLLFLLGFGMGTPILVASILGARVLPKAGQWMHHVKTVFAFIMLALALYFVRPLFSGMWMQILSLILGLSFILYLLLKMTQQQTRLKWLYVLALAFVLPYVAYQQYQQSQIVLAKSDEVTHAWHVVHTAEDFVQVLAQAPKDRGIIIDVYADWCVACQPIEHQILKSKVIQEQLQDYYLIKLDLSQYNQQHQTLLNQWEILGPPTYLFLSPQHQELRSLRLTGAFREKDLLLQLEKFKQQL